MPERGGISMPTSPVAATLAAPSEPAVVEPSAIVNPLGAIVAPPALAMMNCEGPRCGPCPWLTAEAKVDQNSAPVPAMLS
jgi:hypothetical protein